MSESVISSNTTTKILKKFISGNYTINTTPQTIMTISLSEVSEFYYASTTFISGSVTTFIFNLIDMSTGVTYWTYNTNSGALAFNNTLKQAQLVAYPNSELRVNTSVNAGNFNIKLSGISTINSP